MIQRRQTIFPDSIREPIQTRSRIMRRNRRLIMKNSSSTNQLINLFVPISMPRLRAINAEFKESVRYLPRPPYDSDNKPRFPFYTRTFRYLYLYIGERGSLVWQKFRTAYEEIVPKEQRPLQNMIDENERELEKKLEQFIRSGLQLRILIQKKSYPKSKNPLKSFLTSQQVTQLIIQKPPNSPSPIPQLTFHPEIAQKIRPIYSLDNTFEHEIRRSIKMSTKKKVNLQYNFMSIQTRSSQIFHRKNLIQECIKSKEPEEYLEVHGKFARMLAGYDNENIMFQIDKILYENEPNKNARIEKLKQLGRKFQAQQQQFCSWLAQKLSQPQPIECQPDCQTTLFRIIDMYKQQTSIYEIINTNARLSLSVNETSMRQVSTIIKYLYEAIQCFFVKLKNTFKFRQVYRGCLMALEEFGQLGEGCVVMNLGFMSTSMDKGVAQGFAFGRANGTVVEIQMGDQIHEDEDQEGFISLLHVYQCMGAAMKPNYERQKQVLFNPLNIYEVIECRNTYDTINPNIKYLKLRYAPHIALYKKIRNNTATQSQRKKYQQIKSNIASLTRSSYDRGKLLHLRGQSAKALEHYEQVQRSGEILTVQQQLNKIEVLTGNKDYEKVTACVEELIVSYEKKLKEIQEIRKEEGVSGIKTTTTSEKRQKILNLTKQSQYLQMTSNFLEAERRAKKANDESQALSAQMLQQNKKLTDKQFIDSLMLDIKSTALLAKSRCETNDTDSSLCESFDGLKMLDHVYRRCQESIFPKISKILEEVQIPNDERLYGKLNRIKREERRRGNRDEGEDLRQRLKEIKVEKRANENLGKSSANPKDNIDIITKTIAEELGRKSNSKERMFQLFYPAAFQIEQLKGNSNSLKLAKSALLQLREMAEELLEHENQFYSIMKSNLKSANKDIKLCLDNEKRIIEYRFGPLVNLDQELEKDLGRELNTETINEYNKYASFLLEYANTLPEGHEGEKLRSTRRKILRKLGQKIDEESKESSIALTNEKTLLIESESLECKNSCSESYIIETQLNKLKLSNTENKKQTLVKTISSFKTSQSFRDLRENIRRLEAMHQSDSQINKFYYLLKDVTDELELLNNSYSVASSTQEFNDWLAEANRKAELFEEKYIRKVQIRETENLARFYYEKAHNELKLGYFKQSHKSIKKAQDCLQTVYEQKIGEGQRNARKSSSQRLQKLKSDQLNPLYARDVTIICYKLEAELIGVYYGERERRNKLEELVEMRKFVQRVAPNKIIVQAVINEAVAFLTLRCMPRPLLPAESKKKKNKERYQLEYKQYKKSAEECLKQSITLRENLFGAHNEYRAIGYCHLLEIQSGNASTLDRSNIERYCGEGKEIFDSLDKPIPGNQNNTYLDKEPILYLYRMKLEAIERKFSNASQTQPQKQKQISKTYLHNISNFTQKSTSQKSLLISETIMQACQTISKQKQYRAESQKYLQRCEQEIDKINQINEIQKSGEGGEGDGDEEDNGMRLVMGEMKKRLYGAFVEFYGMYGGKAGKKYRDLLEKTEERLKKIPKPKLIAEPVPADGPSLPRPRQPKDDSIFNFFLDVGIACFGGSKY